MDELGGRLRRATGDRLSYDEERGELVVRPRGLAHRRDRCDGGPERRFVVGTQAVRNALQSALLAAEPAPGDVDDALAAGARALLATYDAEPAAAERLVQRSAARFAGTAAARRRRHG